MLVALGLLLFWAAIGRVHDPFSPYLSNLCVSALSLSTVGALIASRRKGNPIGWLFCASGLLFGVQVFAGEYGLYALFIARGACRRATFRGGWPLGLGNSRPARPVLVFALPRRTAAVSSLAHRGVAHGRWDLA
jgi:hypothetical protein